MTHRLLLIGLLLGGCEPVDSDNILTSGMIASFTATADGDGSTSLSAALYLDGGGLDYIDLEGDDRLIAWQGTSERTMSESDIFNIVSYRADFGVDEADTIFRIELRRTVDDGAPNSSVRLPSPFEFVAFPSGTTSRATDLTVTWSPSALADEMTWSASGDCIESESGPITGDPGSLTIGAGTFQKRMPANPGDPAIPDACLVTLTVQRGRDGGIDAAFEGGGSFRAVQTRSTQFTSAP